MTSNLPPFQPRSNGADAVLQSFQRLNQGSMGGLMGRSGGGYNHNPANTAPSMIGSLSSTFNTNNIGATFSQGDAAAPSPFDQSEFPSLGRPGGGVVGESVTHGGHVNNRPGAYSGLSHGWGGIKQPVSEPSEFTMSNEDFPALPGSNKQLKQQPGGQHHQHESFNSDKKNASNNASNTTNTSQAGMGELDFSARSSATTQSTNISSSQDNKSQPKRGIQTSPDGKVTNIPNGMVKDQFGMVGLLTFIRAAENDTNIVSLALGSDLTSLGLNLNSPDNLYPNFGGPWADSPCRPQDIDYHVPQEYLVNQQISMYGRNTKLASINLERYGEDLLFYMFYSNAGDVWQILAATELYNRDWRYHKEEQVWITRAPGLPPSEKGPTFERGTYFYFDVNNWRKVPKEFHLLYDKLDNQPMQVPSMASSKVYSSSIPNQAQSIQAGQQSGQVPPQPQQHLSHHPPSSAMT